MGDRDEEKDGRGWSLVFHDRTDRSTPPETHEAPEQATIIDASIASEVRQGLWASDAPTPDERLANVELALSPELRADNAPEETIRAPVPAFYEDAGSPITNPVPVVTVPDDDVTTFDPPSFSPPASLDEPTDERYAAGDPDATLRPEPDLRRADDPVHATRRAPIPYTLFESANTNHPAREVKITRRKISRAEAPPPDAGRLQIPDQATHLDVAAQLGIAPSEPPPPAEGEISEVIELSPSARDDIELASMLDAPKDLPPPEGYKKKAAVPLPNVRGRPAEGLDAQDLSRLADRADVVARTIPFILATFVILGTIVALTTMISSKEVRQEHVELRFLSVKGPTLRAVRASDDPTRVFVETTPPGVFVLFNREIIGKTPLVVDLPVELDEHVGVELASPYYERWLADIRRTPAGEYHVEAELRKK